MRKPLYIYFRDKQEYIIRNKKVDSKSIGSLLFAFLDIDWTSLKNEAQTLKNQFKIKKSDGNSTQNDQRFEEKCYFLLAKFYQDTYNKFESFHPMLSELIDSNLEDSIDTVYAEDLPVASHFAYRIFKIYPNEPMTPEAIKDFLDGDELIDGISDEPLIKTANTFINLFIVLMDEFIIFKENLLEMITFSLESDRQQDLTNKQRYFIMQNIGFEPYLTYKNLFKEIRIEHRVLSAVDDFDWNNVDELTEKVKLHNLESYPFYSSDDIRSLIMLEFEYMCVNDYYIKKCKNCNGYFQPFSSMATYCERIFQNGKPCKEIAPYLLRKENMSKAKKIYNKVANKMNMRYQRGSWYGTGNLDSWREAAKKVLEKVENDGMDLGEFEKIIDRDLKYINKWLEDNIED